jgi:hypothetical protein
VTSNRSGLPRSNTNTQQTSSRKSSKLNNHQPLHEHACFYQEPYRCLPHCPGALCSEHQPRCSGAVYDLLPGVHAPACYGAIRACKCFFSGSTLKHRRDSHSGATSEKRLYFVCDFDRFRKWLTTTRVPTTQAPSREKRRLRNCMLGQWELRSFSLCRESSFESTKDCCTGHDVEAGEVWYLVSFRRLHISTMRGFQLLFPYPCLSFISTHCSGTIEALRSVDIALSVGCLCNDSNAVQLPCYTVS